tara:strand:+ start:890 stop:1057 length:168 start_codon:yes stop_codon:yes gene_type:complete
MYKVKQLTDPLTQNKKWFEVTINGKVHYVPKKETNRHYQAILEWVADGNTIEDAE